MKVKAEEWIVDGTIVYKILEIERCCNKLICSDNISLNSHYTETQQDDTNEYSVKLVTINTDYDNFPGDSYEKINFCPFCGKPIKIEIVGEVDKTDEYNSLQKKRDLLWKECCKTDSKKQEEILRQQVNGLDRAINDMLRSDDLK